MSMPSRDLFDDTTMSFGEHLEVLRTHLLKAILWLFIGFVISLAFSQQLIIAIQQPVNRAMMKNFAPEQIQGLNEGPGIWERMRGWFGYGKDKEAATPDASPSKDKSGSEKSTVGTSTPQSPSGQRDPSKTDTTIPSGEQAVIPGMTVQIDAIELATKLHEAIPAFPAPPKDAPRVVINVPVRGQALVEMEKGWTLATARPRTDTPDEAFMIYMVVSLTVGFVIASPFIFHELWKFVAAGLYPHERRYVYKYLPFSIILFLGGAFFCFFFVIPAVLDFLFGFNAWLQLRPELRIGAWIKFALVVSLLFGLSFQLPLVMVLLERISIFTSQDYRKKWRHAILAIVVLSMVLTPGSDPISMTLMMTPLCILYGLGIWMCEWGQDKNALDPGDSALSGA